MKIERNSLIKIQAALNQILNSNQEELEIHHHEIELDGLVLLLQLETLKKINFLTELVKVGSNLDKITKQINSNTDKLSSAIKQNTPR